MGGVQAALGGDGGRASADRMTTLMAYADAISVRPGDTIGFKVSCDGAEHYNARIVRLLSPEAGPDGAAVPHRAGRYAGEWPLPRANAAVARRIVGHGAGAPADRLAAQLLHRGADLADAARRWTPGDRRHVERERGHGLRPDVERRPARPNCGSARRCCAAARNCCARKWYFVAASYDAATGAVVLHQDLLADKTMTVASSVTRQATASGVASRNGALAVRGMACGGQRWTGRRSAAGGRLLQRQDRTSALGEPRARSRRAVGADGRHDSRRPGRNRSSRAGISRGTSRPRSSATPRPIAWTASPSICRRAP